MVRILLIAALLATSLSFTACAKYESASWVDNNCSGNGGIYTDEYCMGYTHRSRTP
ncbi:hypothetical protein FRZ44_12910 [Hypericibacter terrae]|jgi:hypothetical protein|uniref:Lipoprotein n=1 Tax=Hypericibacter terrae TaxID=2602015 RepID=A0A5J6MFV8_9PROT|nr:hypothetical protein [Hypericibacter terrae]QEX16001.1 hypothetical protein FRZ44_12910 [Hypericibacter terrae]